MTTAGPERDDLRAVERRIAKGLARLSAVRPLSGQLVGPPAYVRRHLAEHAYVGGILNEDVLPPQFLPHIDLPRLRELTMNWEASGGSAASCSPSLPLLPVLRQLSHLWDFQRPIANAGALQMWAASAQHPTFDPGEPVLQRALWAHWPTSPDEILGQHPGPVRAVAAVVLPDGRPVAVTGGEDATVRIRNLTTGTPVGNPLTGHTSAVGAVATAVLPDGRPLAITGSRDATVLIWDLQRMAAVQEPLHLVGAAAALATLHLPTGVHLAVTGAGITAVELRHQAL